MKTTRREQVKENISGIYKIIPPYEILQDKDEILKSISFKVNTLKTLCEDSLPSMPKQTKKDLFKRAFNKSLELLNQKANPATDVSVPTDKEIKGYISLMLMVYSYEPYLIDASEMKSFLEQYLSCFK